MNKTRIRSNKIREAAKGQNCQISVPGICNHDPLTVVAAHSGRNTDGASMGQKSDDLFVAFACNKCHDFVDGRIHSKHFNNDREWFFNRGMRRTQRLLFNAGIIVIK